LTRPRVNAEVVGIYLGQTLEELKAIRRRQSTPFTSDVSTFPRTVGPKQRLGRASRSRKWPLRAAAPIWMCGGSCSAGSRDKRRHPNLPGRQRIACYQGGRDADWAILWAESRFASDMREGLAAVKKIDIKFSKFDWLV